MVLWLECPGERENEHHLEDQLVPKKGGVRPAKSLRPRLARLGQGGGLLTVQKHGFAHRQPLSSRWAVDPCICSFAGCEQWQEHR